MAVLGSKLLTADNLAFYCFAIKDDIIFKTFKFKSEKTLPICIGIRIGELVNISLHHFTITLAKGEMMCYDCEKVKPR